MSFVKDVSDEQERNSPVRAAVKANAADIQAARREGKPLNAIYRTLKRKGQPVGKGYSSFRNAVCYLDEHGWGSPDDPSSTISPPPPPTPPPPPPKSSDDSVAAAGRDRFVDTRYDSDF